MNREKAIELLHSKLSNINLRRHVYAVEAVMEGLAEKYNGDTKTWRLAGLLHDLDYELTLDDPDRHTYITSEWLECEDGISEEILHSIKAHAGHVGRDSMMDKAIYCADPVTGFIVACALMHPSKKIATLDLKFLKKRFKEKRFAAGASREQIAACSELGMELDEFLILARDSMANIANELGF
jgi:putative nucleotidyltransferase with HDIG domain